MPSCDAPASPLIDVALCSSHSISVYQQVSEMLDRGRKAAAPPRARLAIKDRAGVVYFMRFGQLIKIGFTTDLPQRVKSLRPDQLLALMPGTMRDEESLHARFGPWRDHGEYFRPGLDLLDFIDSLAVADGAT